MPTTDIVPIEKLDEYIALAIEKVNNGVASARKLGIQAELPRELQFSMVVIAPQGWQALEASTTEAGSTKETGGTTETSTTKETSTGKDNGTTTEKQGGFQTETVKGGSSDTTSGTETRKVAAKNSHTQNTDEQTDVYEA